MDWILLRMYLYGFVLPFNLNTLSADTGLCVIKMGKYARYAIKMPKSSTENDKSKI